MDDIPYKHLGENHIDDTYISHNSTGYSEPNAVLSLSAILILIFSSLCCSYRSGQYYMSDFLNRNINIDNNDIKENIIKSGRLKQYEYANTLTDEINKVCCICLDKFEDTDKIVILECKHKFHTNCILNWFNKELNCPLCRKKIDIL